MCFLIGLLQGSHGGCGTVRLQTIDKFVRPSQEKSTPGKKDMLYATNLTDVKVNHFFNIEIFIQEPTIVKLREEGIERPEHLVEFN